MIRQAGQKKAESKLAGNSCRTGPPTTTKDSEDQVVSVDIATDAQSDVGGKWICRATDNELLMRFVRHDDGNCFEELFRRHAGLVLQVCRSILGSYSDADDAFQATFLVLVRRAADLEKVTSLSAWLYRVAYRTSVKANRRRHRRGMSQLIEEPLADSVQFDDISQKELMTVVFRELNQIPTRYKEVLIECYLQGKTYQQTAASLDRTETSVKGLVARGKRILRNRLMRRGVALTFVLALMTRLRTISAAELSGASGSGLTPFSARHFRDAIPPSGESVSASVQSLTQFGVSSMFSNILFKPILAVAVAILATAVPLALMTTIPVRAQDAGVLVEAELRSDHGGDQEGEQDAKSVRLIRNDIPQDNRFLTKSPAFAFENRVQSEDEQERQQRDSNRLRRRTQSEEANPPRLQKNRDEQNERRVEWPLRSRNLQIRDRRQVEERDVEERDVEERDVEDRDLERRRDEELEFGELRESPRRDDEYEYEEEARVQWRESEDGRYENAARLKDVREELRQTEHRRAMLELKISELELRMKASDLNAAAAAEEGMQLRQMMEQLRDRFKRGEISGIEMAKNVSRADMIRMEANSLTFRADAIAIRREIENSKWDGTRMDRRLAELREFIGDLERNADRENDEEEREQAERNETNDKEERERRGDRDRRDGDRRGIERRDRERGDRDRRDGERGDRERESKERRVERKFDREQKRDNRRFGFEEKDGRDVEKERELRRNDEEEIEREKPVREKESGKNRNRQDAGNQDESDEVAAIDAEIQRGVSWLGAGRLFTQPEVESNSTAKIAE